MTQQVRIYCRSKSPTQSGRDKTGDWILEAERPSSQSPEPIMGWTQSGDTMNQIKIEFPSREKAEAFALYNGWRYTSDKPNVRRVKPRNYGDNFVYNSDDS
jgi:hypothetical protein